MTLVCVGKLRDASLRDLADDYQKRIGRKARLEVVEVAHEKVGRSGPALDAVVRAFGSARHRVALEVGGRSVDSPGLAARLRTWVDGGGGISFAIGGPDGIPAPVAQKATERISLSPCTFPHELFRVILLEQIYRAFTIMDGEPYHH